MCCSCSHTKQIGLQNTRCSILLPGNIYLSKSSLGTWTELFSEAQPTELVVSPWLWHCWQRDCLSSNIVRSLLSSLFLPAFIWWSFLDDSLREERFFSFFFRIYTLVQLMYSSFTLIRVYFPQRGDRKSCSCSGFSIPSLSCSVGKFRMHTNPRVIILHIGIKFSSLLQLQWDLMS